MRFEYATGATPIDLDEAAGLIPSHITTQSDLNAWEQANNALGNDWALREMKKKNILSEKFVRDLHRQMFGRTWRWAGTFRTSNKNIGVDWSQVAVRLRDLLDNTRYQLDHRALEIDIAIDEVAVRFHHQLVWIHAFANGNGRHARLMADLLAMKLGRPRLTWGDGQAASITAVGELRQRYLSALRRADQGHLDDLLVFARS